MTSSFFHVFSSLSYLDEGLALFLRVSFIGVVGCEWHTVDWSCATNHRPYATWNAEPDFTGAQEPAPYSKPRDRSWEFKRRKCG